MKVAIAGKGGSGKTTIAGTLASVAAERVPVVAIDDDSNPNLGVTLGLAPDAAAPASLPRDLLTERVDADGTRWLDLTVPADDVIERFGVRVRDNLTLIVMGGPAHGGSG